MCGVLCLCLTRNGRCVLLLLPSPLDAGSTAVSRTKAPGCASGVPPVQL